MGCSYPKRTIAIYFERLYRISYDRAWIVFLVAENFEIMSIETIQSLVGGKPHEALVILYDIKDLVLRQTIFSIVLVKPEVKMLTFYQETGGNQGGKDENKTNS
jgi:hypothetical protein